MFFRGSEVPRCSFDLTEHVVGVRQTDAQSELLEPFPCALRLSAGLVEPLEFPESARDPDSLGAALHLRAEFFVDVEGLSVVFESLLRIALLAQHFANLLVCARDR